LDVVVDIRVANMWLAIRVLWNVSKAQACPFAFEVTYNIDSIAGVSEFGSKQRGNGSTKTMSSHYDFVRRVG